MFNIINKKIYPNSVLGVLFFPLMILFICIVYIIGDKNVF